MDAIAPGTVLVIEDHDSVRIAITRFLKAGGFKALEAATPSEAKTIWAQPANRISLLVVDINLNSSSGPDLVHELLQTGPAVPVIFTTAADETQAEAATSNFQNPTILHKPFGPEALVNAVRTALEDPVALSGFTTFFKRPVKPDLAALN